MKRNVLLFVAVLAWNGISATAGEIPNLLSAVMVARAGDYIILPSGGRYILTHAEIDIANGRFDFGDLSGLVSEMREDGTRIKTISDSHKVFIHPDGQATHLMKTTGSFTSFRKQYLERNFFLGEWVDENLVPRPFKPGTDPGFDVFRATARFSTISDGSRSVLRIEVNAYNLGGKHLVMRYYSEDDFEWGNVMDYGFRQIGESQGIDFELE